MRRTIITAACVTLAFLGNAAQAIPILSVDADTSTAGIQDSLTVSLGDTFSVLTLVSADTPFLDAFDTIIFNLASSSGILGLNAIVADAMAATAPILALDVFSGLIAAPGSALTQGGASGASIGLQSLGLAFGDFTGAGLAGLGDVGIALYTFTASALGTTVLSIEPDFINGGILANAGIPVDSLSLSATINVIDAVRVPEPGTIGLLSLGLALLLVARRTRPVR